MRTTALSKGEIQRLIDNGERVLATQQTKSSATHSYYVVDEFKYGGWRTQVLNSAEISVGKESEYFKGLKGSLVGPYPSSVKKAIEHLNALIEDIDRGIFTNIEDSPDPMKLLNIIFNRFHQIVIQLRSRHDNRNTLDVQDEYDVQDLLHSLLKINFEDIQPEDWTPNYAGNSSRIDFVLREHNMILEVKKTRSNLRNKQLADQLIIDIERYRSYPDIERLVCFVYDPDGYISNPRGFEKDINRAREGINVDVLIRPYHD